jgi:uncharacterized protein YbjT (DUF2867 family)
MKVIMLGATGMIGQGVLRECLLDASVTSVLSIGRSTTGKQDPKLREIVLGDLSDLSSIESDLAGYQACFYCLGISSLGITEPAYRKITYDMPMAAAQTLARLSPDLTFIYVSGSGADTSEDGSVMWARVKGAAENALSRLPLKTYVFRPAFVQPLNGVVSKTKWINALYALFRPFTPLLMRLMPNYSSTTTDIGRAMIAVACKGYPVRLLESPEIVRAAATTP